MKTGVYTHITENGSESYAFNFKTSLSVSDKIIFVRTVVDTIVDDNNYDSVLRNLIFDYNVINMMTDIDTSFLKEVNEYGGMVTNIDLLEEFLLETNIIEIVKANAFPTLFEELNNAVDKSISYRTGVHTNPLNDALSSLFSTIEKKINEVDLNDSTEMIRKLANMGEDFTMENLVKAYMNSDLHKANLEEITDSKKNKKNRKNEIKIDESLGEAIRTVVKEAKSEKSEN